MNALRDCSDALLAGCSGSGQRHSVCQNAATVPPGRGPEPPRPCAHTAWNLVAEGDLQIIRVVCRAGIEIGGRHMEKLANSETLPLIKGSGFRVFPCKIKGGSASFIGAAAISEGDGAVPQVAILRRRARHVQWRYQPWQ